LKLVKVRRFAWLIEDQKPYGWLLGYTEYLSVLSYCPVEGVGQADRSNHGNVTVGEHHLATVESEVEHVTKRRPFHTNIPVDNFLNN